MNAWITDFHDFEACGEMGNTWITNMNHFLDEMGAIPDRPRMVAGVRDHLGAIVVFVTGSSASDEDWSPVRCRRRPRRKPCQGWIRARLDPDSRQIMWMCPICEDRGVISGWEHTPWDLSGNDSPATAVAPQFTPAAQRIWAGVDAGMRIRLLNNVWCSSCCNSCSMELLGGRVERGDLVLDGRCVTCGGLVARVVESR